MIFDMLYFYILEVSIATMICIIVIKLLEG